MRLFTAATLGLFIAGAASASDISSGSVIENRAHSSEAGRLSAVLDWSVGLAPDPGQELSAGGSYELIQTSRGAASANVEFAWTTGFISKSPPVFTSIAGMNLAWLPFDLGPWLLTAEPFLIHRAVNADSALLWPGLRVALEYLAPDQRFALEYSDERAIPLLSELELLRGTRQMLRALWAVSDIGPADEAGFGILAQNDRISGTSSIGPEGFATVPFRDSWRGEIYARAGFGTSREFAASARLKWLVRAELVAHTEISRTGNPDSEEWASLTGISWSIH